MAAGRCSFAQKEYSACEHLVSTILTGEMGKYGAGLVAVSGVAAEAAEVAGPSTTAAGRSTRMNRVPTASTAQLGTL